MGRAQSLKSQDKKSLDLAVMVAEKFDKVDDLGQLIAAVDLKILKTNEMSLVLEELFNS